VFTRGTGTYPKPDESTRTPHYTFPECTVSCYLNCTLIAFTGHSYTDNRTHNKELNFSLEIKSLACLLLSWGWNAS